MKHIIFTIFAFSLFLSACKKNNPSHPASAFDDYGYVSSSSVSGPDRMFYYKGQIFVATDDGIWKIGIGESQWRRAGLAGKKINCLYNHPDIDGKFFAAIVTSDPAEKTLYISQNAAASWEAAASPVFDEFNNAYETYYDITARPGHPQHVYANLSGATIAISKDGGETWNRQNYSSDSYFGDFCVIHILHDKQDVVFQGAEAPLDHAWLGTYLIDQADPVKLGELQQIIGKNYEWENRRPNSLESFTANPGVLYVGMEGALSKVTGSSYEYIFKQGMDSTDFPYTYVKGIWMDKANKRHLVFGGGINGINTSLSLYETFDEGKTIVHLKDKLGLQDPDIIDIVDAASHPAILIRDNGNGNKLKLVIYQGK